MKGDIKMPNFKRIEELDARINEQRKFILNQTQVVENKAKSEKKVTVRQQNREPGKLEKLILKVLNKITSHQASPKYIHAIIVSNYTDEYNAKRITDKCWQMEKKGVLKKIDTGVYGI